jgi:hypothetical protein
MLFITIIAFTQEKEVKAHFIGEKFGGGIIYYIDETGRHGLIAALSDQSDGVRWGRSHKRVGATNINDGQPNTKLIVESCEDYTAADVCDKYEYNEFDDWYLPSLYELQLIYENRMKVDGLTTADYCSSSEATKGTNDCWAIHFGKNGKNFMYNKSFHYSVRPVRKF